MKTGLVMGSGYLYLWCFCTGGVKGYVTAIFCIIISAALYAMIIVTVLLSLKAQCKEKGCRVLPPQIIRSIYGIYN